MLQLGRPSAQKVTYLAWYCDVVENQRGENVLNGVATVYQVQRSLSNDSAPRPERTPTSDRTSPGDWPSRDRSDERRLVLR